MTNVNPNFDQDLPRKGVLSPTTGKGRRTPTGADNYRQQFAAELTFEVWPIEHLIEMMVDAPESGLAGELRCPLIGAVAAIHLGTLRERQLDELSLSWIGHGVADLPRSALAALGHRRTPRSFRSSGPGLPGRATIGALDLGNGSWCGSATAGGSLATADLGQAILVYGTHRTPRGIRRRSGGSTAFLGATIDAGAM